VQRILAPHQLAPRVFRSVDDLNIAINSFVAETNAEPNPSSGPQIPTASSPPSKRGKQALESVHEHEPWPTSRLLVA
jgi:hypothetical protein